MIPLFGVARQTARLRAALRARLDAVLDHGGFVLGPEVQAFEVQLADHCGAGGAVGVGSGWDALAIALQAEGVGPGDAVFVPAFTFTATADAVVACGAVPVFVDVRAADCNLDPSALAEALDAVHRAGRLRPRAVIPVDLYGLPADYAAIRAAIAAAPEPMFILADAAQSFGGARDGVPVGAMAPVTALSFYPTKPLGGLGDGGAILADDPARLARYRAMRNCGRGPDGLQHEPVGPSARLDTLQAAALLTKLDSCAAERARRAEIAACYDSAFGDRVGLPERHAGVESAWALYTLFTPRRDALKAALAGAGVPSAIYYPAPLPAHPAFRGFAPDWPVPVAKQLAGTVLSLPLHAELTDAEVDQVCEAVRAAT